MLAHSVEIINTRTRRDTNTTQTRKKPHKRNEYTQIRVRLTLSDWNGAMAVVRPTFRFERVPFSPGI
jgi:hypothetical protein